MSRVAYGGASVAFCEQRAGRPDAFMQGGVPTLGEDETFVGAHSSAVWDLGKVAFFSLGSKPFFRGLWTMEWNERG